MTLRETIAAIATPPGVGGLGLVRVSGQAAQVIAQRLFRPLPAGGFVSHRLYHGEIVSPGSGDVLDDVLIAFFAAPRSYTGEDTCEISCHGGPLILRTVMEEILRCGARPAERGEFTRRAFLNSRLELSQAEAVLDVITARTRPGLAAALDRLKGGLSARVESLRGQIVDLLAGVEAAIDFTEDDGAGGVAPPDTLPRIEAVIDRIGALAGTYRQGRIYREGVGVVIAGLPNVGKSSLLNCLLGEKRAIVTPIPGTTRDFIEETADIGGIPVRLTDTAGLRAPADAVEQAGIDLVWMRLESADAVLVLLDGSRGLSAEDRQLLSQVAARPLLVVVNKADLPARLDADALGGLLPAGAPPPVWISAKYGHGVDRLAGALRQLVLATPAQEAPEALIAHLHQKTALEKAALRLGRARDGLRDSLPPELVAVEIRDALDAMGEIGGRTTPEEVLERIFAKFCIGK